jgi:hypothetical protein
MGSGRGYLTTRILPLPEAEVWPESPRLPRRRDPRSPALRRSPLPSPRRCGREALPPTTSLPRRALRTEPPASNAAASARKPGFDRTNSPGASTSSSWPSSSHPPGRVERLSSRATASERLSARLRVFALLRACRPPNAELPISVSSPIRACPPDRARSRPSSCRRRTGRFSASLRGPPFLLFSPLQPPSPTGVHRGSDHTIPSLSRRVEARGRPRGEARPLEPCRR